MNKTLHTKLTRKYSPTHTRQTNVDAGEQLVDLMRDMKGYLREAAKDLLQPRPEAVNRILNSLKSEV